MQTFALLIKKQYSPDNTSWWTFGGWAETEEQVGEFVRSTEEEIKRSKDSVIETLSYQVVELKADDLTT